MVDNRLPVSVPLKVFGWVTVNLAEIQDALSSNCCFLCTFDELCSYYTRTTRLVFIASI